jgi:hypothetical protein
MTHKVFNLSTGADTGGAAIRSVEAFRSQAGFLSGWSVRSMVASSNYIDYAPDVPYSMDRLRQLYKEAEVIHLNHTLHGHSWYDDGQGKPVVLEHHGLHKGAFDIDFEAAIKAACDLGALQIGSTANLELFAESGVIRWAPIPYDLAWLQAIRGRAQTSLSGRGHGARYQDPSVLTIAHAPTNRAIKSTEAFIAAIASLKAKGLPIEGLLIERKSNLECLSLKAKADIFVDQLVLGYGCNAIEAWGMGLPVVGGISDPTWRVHMQARWGGMPLYEATEANLVDRLEALVLSSDLREEFIERGQTHFLRHHTQRAHVKLMADIYEEASQHPTKIGTSMKGMSHAQRLVLLRANRKARQEKLSSRQ